jgi:hypothetical protein
MFRWLYEGLVDEIAGLLKNRPRSRVATKVPISGDVEAPQSNTWETIVRLNQNTFFKAILPELKKKLARAGRSLVRLSNFRV